LDVHVEQKRVFASPWLSCCGSNSVSSMTDNPCSTSKHIGQKQKIGRHSSWPRSGLL
jgi:hypothetical protein